MQYIVRFVTESLGKYRCLKKKKRFSFSGSILKTSIQGAGIVYVLFSFVYQDAVTVDVARRVTHHSTQAV